MIQPGRSFNSSSYKYGYQGSEKDSEISGEGNHFTTLYREGDTRILRWWSVDPKASDQPWQSPYSYMDGNPVANNDPEGDVTGGLGVLNPIQMQKGIETFAKGVFNVAVDIFNSFSDPISNANYAGNTKDPVKKAAYTKAANEGAKGIAVGVATGYAAGRVLKVGSSLLKRSTAATVEAESTVILSKERYPGVAADYNSRTVGQLQKTIKSTTKTIAEHEGYIKNPLSKPGMTAEKWEGMSEQAQKGLLNKWAKDIDRNKAYLDIAKDALKAKQQ